MNFSSQVFLNSYQRRLILLTAPVLLLLCFFFAQQARKNASNRVVDWLPSGLGETHAFFEFLRHFPDGELIMTSWDGATISDPAFARIAARLLVPAENGNKNSTYFSRVLTSQAMRDLLTEPPLNLSRFEAKKRLRGWMLGKEDDSACLVTYLSHAGLKNRHAAVERILEVVREETQLPDAAIHIAGPSIDSVAIDNITATSQRQLMPFFLLLCFGLLLASLRHFGAAVGVIFIAATNSELGPALVYLTGGHLDSISLLISSLVYVLTISTGVHLVNYYRETLREIPNSVEKSGCEETLAAQRGCDIAEGEASRMTRLGSAPIETLRKAWLPCFLAMFTTVLGLSSLAASQMVPIRNFGIYASATLILGTFWLFVVFIAAMQEFPIRVWRNSARNEKNEESHRWHLVAAWVNRHHTPLMRISLIMLIFCAAGLPLLKTNVTFHGMFPPQAKVIQDYNALEEKIGGLVPIEVMLTATPTRDDDFILKTVENSSLGNPAAQRGCDIVEGEASSPTRLGYTILRELWLLQEATARLSQVHGVDTVISVLQFSPPIPSRGAADMRSVATRRAMLAVLPKHFAAFEESRFLQREISAENQPPISRWRISLRIPAREHINYDSLLSEVRTILAEVVAQHTKDGAMKIETLVTGGVPLVHKAQSQLLRDLIQSFLLAFVMIAITMMILLRGIARGLVAMIPNVFPCVIIFGAMAWCGRAVDMGSMMTASVAMGVAVDGTLHFMTWFHRGMQAEKTRAESIEYAYNHCATALTQTTLICGLGMLVFCASGFLPIAQFATLLCLLLFAALVGDLIVLPAILYGSLGKIFR